MHCLLQCYTVSGAAMRPGIKVLIALYDAWHSNEELQSRSHFLKALDDEVHIVEAYYLLAAYTLTTPVEIFPTIPRMHIFYRQLQCFPCGQNLYRLSG